MEANSFEKSNWLKAVLIISTILLLVVFIYVLIFIIQCPVKRNVYVTAIQSYLTCLAILAGAIWAIWKFFALREDALGLSIEATLQEISKINNKDNWVIIQVMLKNVGKRRIYLGKLEYSCYEINDKGLEFVFESDEDWLCLFADEDRDDYIEPSEILSRVLYAILDKNRENLIFRISFRDRTKVSAFSFRKRTEQCWRHYIFVRNNINK